MWTNIPGKLIATIRNNSTGEGIEFVLKHAGCWTDVIVAIWQSSACKAFYFSVERELSEV